MSPSENSRHRPRSTDQSPDKLKDKLTDKSQSIPITTGQPGPNSSQKPADVSTPKPHNSLPLKIFFLLVSIGLFLSTISGIYMSYKYIRKRLLLTAILSAGIVIPILLTIL
ncbi:hypothetical protein [Tunturiibacter gelidiferens]|uniref:hypothetical protein n=1 Tax=Tunturiibacter gelidiferens TaxID=3069689 RepID=UPI003D9B8442